MVLGLMAVYIAPGFTYYKNYLNSLSNFQEAKSLLSLAGALHTYWSNQL